jgi:NADH dehydrogenase
MTDRIAVTGANGAVGQAILRLALSEKRPIVAVVRSERAAASLPEIPGELGTMAQIAYDQPESLEAAFKDANALIHLPGLLIEQPNASYEAANVETTRVALDAVRRTGVKKFVLASAFGADPNATNRFFRTKGEAENLVAGSGLSYTIIRAPLVLGPGTKGTQANLRHVRGRTTWLLGGGRNLQQPLDVDDLARGLLRAASDPDVARNRTLDLAGPVSLSDREIVERTARLLGRPIRVLPVPTGPVRYLMRLRTRLFGPGFSPEVLEVMMTDTRIDPEPAARELGISLTPLDTTLRHGTDPGQAP